MADGRGDDEGHAPAGLQQARRRHEEGRPGGGEPRKPRAQAGAQCEGALAYLAVEGLVADEGRVARGAFEALAGARGPGEEVALVDAGPGSPAHRHGRGPGVLLDAEAVPVGGDEASVSAGGVEHPVAVFPDRPPDEVRNDGVRRVVGAGLLLREAGHRGASLRSLGHRVRPHRDAASRKADARLGDDARRYAPPMNRAGAGWKEFYAMRASDERRLRERAARRVRAGGEDRHPGDDLVRLAPGSGLRPPEHRRCRRLFRLGRDPGQLPEHRRVGSALRQGGEGFGQRGFTGCHVRLRPREGTALQPATALFSPPAMYHLPLGLPEAAAGRAR